ncbi:thiamine ABC transporter substrate binding subunit [Paracoccus sp. 1_MG-2023]|uniref:thiamine ABC transporter substrate-binding protein n=1 Tax=unclassified Paracoccus (in: a-proteobacteria) TaxID=2688777 RepID=UPI001C09B172|nr:MULTISPECIES: thiamine ABC transporter substrate binding subunit [unclassified Paracoccus (in: a-proteobacteria)]MBU2957293.1 thiamine ABC transporter substrate-binding protein [Paracoccus sp. C2R09]MDO6669939.1 thiamine ABC transporter substrate binding subunit [Paracoccus sp. 1_MG-2023]
MRTPLILSVLLAAGPAIAQDKPVLTVYAGDYIASEWGPGPRIEEGFEAFCECDLQFVTGDILPRILLEGEGTEADIVFGLNTDVTARARASGLFAPHGQDTSDLSLPVEWTDEVFLPYNWGETAFIYDETRLENPPASFEELLDAPDDLKIAIQDPRSSISGLALLLWVKSVYGDGAPEAWEKLAPKVLTVTRGWSESYGLFTEGEVDMVLSYTTSPAYHIEAEDDLTKKAAIFPEGHYLMAELAAQVASTDQPELAQEFMDWILTPDFQRAIPLANWSLPAKLPQDDWPQVMRDLPRPDKTFFQPEDKAEEMREPALDEWLRAFSG